MSRHSAAVVGSGDARVSFKLKIIKNKLSRICSKENTVYLTPVSRSLSHSRARGRSCSFAHRVTHTAHTRTHTARPRRSRLTNRPPTRVRPRYNRDSIRLFTRRYTHTPFTHTKSDPYLFKSHPSPWTGSPSTRPIEFARTVTFTDRSWKDRSGFLPIDRSIARPGGTPW